MLRQQLQQRLQQKLSPQQIQLIRLLELPTIELEERIKHELEENPALEEGKDEEDKSDQPEDLSLDEGPEEKGETEADLSLGDYLSEDDIPEYKLREMRERAEQKEDIPFSVGQSLNEYLLEQLGLRDLPEEERQMAEYIVGNMEDDGYLRRDLAAIADDMAFQTGTEVTVEALEHVLSLVQGLEPPGIGARNLQECLLLQLKRHTPSPANANARNIVENYFDDFSRKHFDKIMLALDIDEEKLKAAISEITALDPKPGNGWEGSILTAHNQVTPDFLVEADNGELTLTMNNRSIPELHLSQDYRDMLRDYAKGKDQVDNSRREALQFVKQKLDSAQGFIDAVKQRQQTLQRTMEIIMVLQRPFFLSGDEATLRPMILKDVAERAGYDISTISRVSNSKYVQTNFGIYPLKFFFSESLQTESGEEVSTREVKKIMKENLDAEDKRKPLTDAELAAILKAKGYLIARRTVAKYREQLGISVARLRKEI
ncbi:MAG: RNA polymerase factor sigma-54 [Tannerella sp.]|jgi:RNA polymerase sigma-54 factor|nr:RNA polymerase factor sigma-54 [Tannerella sp.]